MLIFYVISNVIFEWLNYKNAQFTIVNAKFNLCHSNFETNTLKLCHIGDSKYPFYKIFQKHIKMLNKVILYFRTIFSLLNNL